MKILFLWLIMAAPVMAAQTDSIHITSIAPVDGISLRITWEGAVPPYKLQIADPVDGAWRDVTYHIYTNSYVVSNIFPQAYYRVRTIPDKTPPPSLKGFGPRQVDCNAVLFTWDALQPDVVGGTGLRGTRIYRDGIFLIEIPMPRAVFIDTAVLGGAPYTYWASAVDVAGNESPRSGARAIETPPCDPPPGPTVTLAWDPNPEPDIAGYIFRYGYATGVYPFRIDVSNVTMHTVLGLTSGVNYYFAVSAYNFIGLESDLSNEVIYGVP